MKYIVIGLGNFGAVLAEHLTLQGHEVIGVDEDIHKVEDLKDTLASAICLDSRDRHALLTLPIMDADAVFVTIGEDFGASVYTIALLKQLGVGKLVGRTLSPIHKTILEAIGVDETISPERGYAELYATKVDIPGLIGNYMFSDEYRVIEITAPGFILGLTASDVDFEGNYTLKLLSVKRRSQPKGTFSLTKSKDLIINEFSASDTANAFEFKKDDVLLLYGKVQDLKKWMNT